LKKEKKKMPLLGTPILFIVSGGVRMRRESWETPARAKRWEEWIDYNYRCGVSVNKVNFREVKAN
jgi:hypothetical protein